MGRFINLSAKEIKPLYDTLNERYLEDFFFPYLHNEMYPFPPSVVLENGQLLDGHKRIAMADLFGIKPIVYVADPKEFFEKDFLGMKEEEHFMLKVRFGQYEHGLRSYFDNVSQMRKNIWYLSSLETAKKYFHMKNLNLI